MLSPVNCYSALVVIVLIVKRFEVLHKAPHECLLLAVSQRSEAKQVLFLLKFFYFFLLAVSQRSAAKRSETGFVFVKVFVFFFLF